MSPKTLVRKEATGGLGESLVVRFMMRRFIPAPGRRDRPQMKKLSPVRDATGRSPAGRPAQPTVTMARQAGR